VRRVLWIVGILLALVGTGYFGLRADVATKFSYSKLEISNQSGSLASTTLFTPSADGDYVVMVSLEFIGPCCGGGDNTSEDTELTWSDNTNSYTHQVGNFAAHGAATNSGVTSMHVKSGQAVQLYTTEGGTTGTHYNVFVTVIGQ